MALTGLKLVQSEKATPTTCLSDQDHGIIGAKRLGILHPADSTSQPESGKIINIDESCPGCMRVFSRDVKKGKQVVFE